jgi:protocatechuate 3,4-dioxygenase beta subunit
MWVRRTVAVPALISALLAGLSAQDPPRDGPPRARTGSAVIRGRVVAADTGTPIRDAVVTIMETNPGASSVSIVSALGSQSVQRAPLGTASLDDEGRFELTDIPPGRHVLTVRPGPGAARYLSQQYPDPQSETADPLELRAGQTAHLTVALARAGAINGRLYDERGDPLAFAHVSAVELLPGGRQLSPQTASATARMIGRGIMSDDNGAFRLFSLSPGQYVVFVMAFPRTTAGAGRAPVVTPARVVYYPGTPNAHEAAPITVAAGGEAAIEFTVPTVRTFTLRGTVVDQSGAAVPNLIVIVRPRDWTPQQLPDSHIANTGNTGPDGTFAISNIGPGDKMLSVLRRGVSSPGVPRVDYARVPLTIDRDGDVIVQLRSSATIRGTAGFEGEPQDYDYVQVRYVPAGESGSDGSGSVRVQTDRSFVLEHLVGPMLIRISAARWHLKSVYYGQEDVTDTPIEFRSGDERELTVTVSRQLGTVSGAVTTAAGKDVGARIILFSADRALWHDRFSTTKTTLTLDGKYRIEGLRAGRYLAVAIPIDEGEITNAPASFYDLLSRTATAITVAEGPQSLNLRLTRLR